jgi:hypothetical protein
MPVWVLAAANVTVVALDENGMADAYVLAYVL